MFVANFKILGAVVPKKSLTKKKKLHTPTHTDKHCYGKDENYIPPYTSYVGGIMKLDTLINGHQRKCSARTITLSQVIRELFPFLILPIVSLSGAYL